MQMDSDYCAFLSYSHINEHVVSDLHQRLENFKLPKRKNKKVRLFPIFRDTDELPTSSDLGDNLQQALRNSRYLVVVISKHSMTSEWVSEEVRLYSEHHTDDKIILLFLEHVDTKHYRKHFVNALSDRVEKIYYYQYDIKITATKIASLLAGVSTQRILIYQRRRKLKMFLLGVAVTPILVFAGIILQSIFVSYGMLKGQMGFNEKFLAQTNELQTRMVKDLMSEAQSQYIATKKPLSIDDFNDALSLIGRDIELVERGLKDTDIEPRFLEIDFQNIKLMLNTLREEDLSLVGDEKLEHLLSLEKRFSVAFEKLEAIRSERPSIKKSPFQ